MQMGAHGFARFGGKRGLSPIGFPYDGDDGWVEGALAAIRDTLRAPEPPAVNGECEYCRFAAGSAGA